MSVTDWLKAPGALFFWLLMFWKPKAKPEAQANITYNPQGWEPAPCPKCGKPAVNDFQSMDGHEFGYYCNACKFAFTVKR